MELWKGLGDELREMLWLASLVGALSVVGVGLAVLVALVLDHWQTWSAAALSQLT
ncbi:MAG TPA: hypothetical protein VFR00_01300 [Hyphomicrobiaceae bacterium]|jgi:hypothetical protein|nr:hypothetical protein [Hyphomicrobiaceae bacterium]